MELFVIVIAVFCSIVLSCFFTEMAFRKLHGPMLVVAVAAIDTFVSFWGPLIVGIKRKCWWAVGAAVVVAVLTFLIMF